MVPEFEPVSHYHGQLREVRQGEVASDDVHVDLDPSWGPSRSQREARLAGATLTWRAPSGFAK